MSPREFSIDEGHYENEAQEIKLLDMMQSFALRVNDIDASKNLLGGGNFQFEDWQIIAFLKEGVKDLNRGTPVTKHTIFSFPDQELVVTAAVIQALVSEGLLQLRNQIDFNDSGFTMAMFNKTGGYQSWVGFMLQTYFQDKKDYKNGIIPRGRNSGFVNISSEFGYRYPRS